MVMPIVLAAGENASDLAGVELLDLVVPVEVAEERRRVGHAVGEADRARERDRVLERELPHVVAVVGAERVLRLGPPEQAADLARLLAGPVRLRPAVAVHRVEVRLGVPRLVVPPLPVRVLRQVELLAVDGQVAEVHLHPGAEPGDVEQAEAVELGRRPPDLLVEPDDVRGLVVEPERDAAVALPGVGPLPPPVLVVPLEVLDEALVADLEQPPCSSSRVRPGSSFFSRSNRCSSPWSS